MTTSAGDSLVVAGRRVVLVASALAACLAFRGSRPLAAQTVSIYPQVASTTQPASTTGLKSTFTVINSTSFQVILYCGATGTITCTRLSAGYINPNSNLIDTAVYSSGAVGSGTVVLRTELVNGQVDSGYYSITVVPAYQVSVTPKGALAPVRTTNTGGYSAVFTVTPTGYYSDTYTMTCGSTGPVTCTSVKPASLSNGTDTAFYNVGVVGSGTVTLTASSTHTSDVGWDTVLVRPAPVTPTGPLVAREQCLTIAAGPAAAYECGDLRIVHALPGTRTLGKLRTPILFYNGQSAYPFPSLNGDLTLVANDRPDSIIAIARLKVGGSFIQRDRRAWAGTQWGVATQPATRRVMTNFAANDLATGLYPFQLELDRYVSGTGYTAIRTDTGTITIINRIASPFGAGWWLAGFEQLQFPADGSIMWIGADGSARRYVSAGSWNGKTWYVARPLEGPDTLSFDGTTYTRFLKGGTRVLFNTTGFHTQTVSRLGYATIFTPDGSNRLSTITLPPTGGLGRTYTFTYGGPNGTLSSVASPDSAGGSTRVTTITASALTGGGARISSIKDPGDTAVQFGYGNGSYPGAITSRTDRRGNTTTFFLGAGLKLVGDSLPVAGTQPVKRTFCPAEIRVWACGTGLTAPESTYTLYDGPRTDSTDATEYWMDSLGQVVQIRDAYNGITTIARADARWPALATRTQDPGGHVLAATYDGRGNIASVADSNPYGDGRTATTQFTWDQAWDQLTQITLPNGQLTQFGVDATNGNRLWGQDSRGMPSRTTFQYYGSGNGAELLSAVIPPTGGARTTLTYDVRGNTASVQIGPWTTSYFNDSIGRTKVVQSPISSGQYRYDTTTYDLLDRVVRTASYAPSVGGASHWLAVRYNTYDPEGNLIEVQRLQVPDSTFVGWLTTQWNYDAANRATVEIAPDGYRDSTTYDAAGNPISVKNRNGHILAMSYDRMNRLSRRIVPSVTAPADTSLGLLVRLSLTGDGYPGVHPYPWFPNSGSGLKINADTATFLYDADGRLIKGDNGDARVHRTYFKDGNIQTDSTWLRDYADSAFGHVYGLRYVYDLNGRPVVIHHPSQLAMGSGMRDSVRYAYDAATGAIDTVTSLLGNQTTFLYDYRGELIRGALPGQITDSLVYDSLGRTTLDRIANKSTSTYKDADSLLRLATLHYDTDPWRPSAVINSHGWRDTVYAYYGGLGALTALDYGRPANTADTALYVSIGGDGTTQNFSVDPLGNTRLGTGTTRGSLGFGSSFWQGSATSSYYHNGTARIDSTLSADNDYGFLYDSAGNTVFQYAASTTNNSGATLNDRASWYSADGLLRVAEWREAFNDGQWLNPAWTDVFEEYRYDALGRRVLVMSRQNCYFGSDSTAHFDCAISRVRRTVWDGSREAWEIQMPASPTSALVENDTGTVTYWSGTRWDGLYSDPNPLFGRVAYAYAGGLDHPITVTRLKLVRKKTAADSVYWNPTELEPRWNWRGEAELGTFADGGMKTCTNSTHCVFVQWRGVAFTVGLASELLWTQPYGWSPYGWFGTLIQNKADGTGTMYHRNRYVDPVTGRFTQEDPAGLAGGLNLYGFAQGDPVNFADPLGLCRVDVRYAKLGSIFGKPWYHAYVVTTAPDATQVYFRGGPSGEGPSGGSSGQLSSASGGSSGQSSGSNSSQSSNSGQSSNSSNSSSPGSGKGGQGQDNGPWNQIAVQSGKYQPGTVDYDAGAPPSQTVVDNSDPCDKYNASFAKTLAAIGDAGIPYNPFSSNSNAVVHELLSQAGLNVGKPAVWVPGWNTRLLP